MKRIITLLLFFTATQLAAQELRAKLEASYKAFTQALEAKDSTKLKNALSSYAYMSIKNQLISSDLKFPEDFFAHSAEIEVDLKKLKYIKAVSKGPTAYSFYAGKEDGENMLFIFSFLEENGQWKFNLLKGEGSETLSKKIGAGDFSFLADKKYQPDGILPATPKAIAKGDYRAVLDISTGGYEVEVWVNGVLQKKTEAGSYSGAILGGIKKGVNTVEITILAKRKESMFPLSVAVRALVGEEEKEVFTFKDKAPSGTIKKDFMVE